MIKKIKFRIALGVSVIAWYLLVWAIGEKEAYKMGKDLWTGDR